MWWGFVFLVEFMGRVGTAVWVRSVVALMGSVRVVGFVWVRGPVLQVVVCSRLWNFCGKLSWRGWLEDAAGDVAQQHKYVDV
jgi:hypothetical protein